MPSVLSIAIDSSVKAQSDQSAANNHKEINPERVLEEMQASSHESPSNDGPNAHSVSTPSQSFSPRSSRTSKSAEEELVVVFESKSDYMNQEAFDEAMRRHGIQEEVTHRIRRVETKDMDALPDAQWDDPCENLFPVRCIYWKLVRDFPEESPMPSLPSSMPTTPELPMRELAPDSSALAASFFASQLGAASSKSPAWYAVAFCGGISIREAPDSQAPTIGVTLPCNDIFEVSDSILGFDQRLYLKLANGCGWVFDDSLLFPDDPSVRKLQSMPDVASLAGSCSMNWGHPLATVPQSPTIRGHYEEHVPIPPMFTHSAAASTSNNAMPFAASPPSTLGCLDRTPGLTLIPLASVPYQVQAPGGVSVQVAPSVSAAPTGFVLNQGDIFHVCESIVGSDGKQYLKLADGRGWVLAESRDQDATGSQVPLPVGQVLSSQPSSQQQASQDDRKSAAKSQDSSPKAHVPYWVRLRRAKQLGLPLAHKKSKGGAGRA